jgi:formate dehydrogenase maturation protein FdhE
VIYTTENLAAFAEAYGPGVIFLDWKEQLRCSVCGSAKVQFVLSRHKTPGERWRECICCAPG